MPEFVRDNAGKAFEFMVEKVDGERKAAGLSTIEECFAGEQGEKKPSRRRRPDLRTHEPWMLSGGRCLVPGAQVVRV